jgi:DNA-binding CsgD family transcriptional regulator
MSHHEGREHTGDDASPARDAGVRATLAWLTEFIAVPVALVGRDGGVRCNGALERMLARESEAGRRRLRDALRRLGEAMLAAVTGVPPLFDERLLRVRTSSRRYQLEPLLPPRGATIGGLIHVHRSRAVHDPESVSTRFGLTRREAEVALLIASGLSNKSIAAELALSPHTVRRHTENVFRKVGVTSRTALSARLH